uniref:UDP-galactose transporter n=1 Tax=Chromera velia CCMP2878 TaxID=1169474 RepID=A0A0G4H1Z2_9ALVE|eukprot:Cvel_24331.t1-p1 / transcript=Cvel_24331.t1 / gene=Cvel_24331 / organism=Chromera_velia_CCMP2878 / gene_product=UDP-N-acetylglucosamine transporter, putative / transcript_product=UDP-N-acetylglucosamine transporter, putative / location=Cvel_scaffold2616:23067-24317(-) / protein_length=417 / sequence_SO=supercontig / SO=protein_coding / is_pseudo=false
MSVPAKTVGGQETATPPPIVSSKKPPTFMRMLSLVLLILQTTAVICVTRYSRQVPSERPYLNTTVVFFSEVAKLVTSFCFVLVETVAEGKSVARGVTAVGQTVFLKPWDTFLVGVPAILYVAQNNLLFVAMSNLSGALYQVTYQLKILSTALLSVIILHKALGRVKWLALILLTAGAALIQLPSGDSNVFASKAGGDPVVGVGAVLFACLTSGFAGVWFEWILKASKVSIWMRNIQLALYGVVLGFVTAMMKDREKIVENGFLQGYNWVVWMVILLQAVGGLIVAAVLKYADNILKCFGNAASILLTCAVGYYFLGDFEPSMPFGVGTCCVIASTYLYSVGASLRPIFDTLGMTKFSKSGMPSSMEGVQMGLMRSEEKERHSHAHPGAFPRRNSNSNSPDPQIPTNSGAPDEKPLPV